MGLAASDNVENDKTEIIKERIIRCNVVERKMCSESSAIVYFFSGIKRTYLPTAQYEKKKITENQKINKLSISS